MFRQIAPRDCEAKRGTAILGALRACGKHAALPRDGRRSKLSVESAARPRRITAMERHLVKAPTPGSGVGVWIPTRKPETTDEAGRFDDESLCYSRVAPVARHLAA